MPCLKRFKGFAPCNIIREQDTVRPLVEYFGYRLEGLLARRVPDLQLENLLV